MQSAHTAAIFGCGRGLARKGRISIVNMVTEYASKTAATRISKDTTEVLKHP